MIKVVIFDLDGVIVESENAHIDAEKQTFLKYDIKISSEELHKYTGSTAKVMFTELIKRYNLNTTFEKIFAEKEKILYELLEKDAEPTKGVIDLLRELRQRNIKLAIGSSSTKKMIRYLLEKLGITYLFDSVISSEDVAHSKPHPEVFMKAAAELGVDPGECAVVEDSELGIEAAKCAGMKCIGYRNPNSGNQDLSKADLIIDDFSKADVQGLLSET